MLACRHHTHFDSNIGVPDDASITSIVGTNGRVLSALGPLAKSLTSYFADIMYCRLSGTALSVR